MSNETMFLFCSPDDYLFMILIKTKSLTIVFNIIIVQFLSLGLVDET